MVHMQRGKLITLLSLHAWADYAIPVYAQPRSLHRQVTSVDGSSPFLDNLVPQATDIIPYAHT